MQKTVHRVDSKLYGYHTKKFSQETLYITNDLFLQTWQAKDLTWSIYLHACRSAKSPYEKNRIGLK